MNHPNIARRSTHTFSRLRSLRAHVFLSLRALYVFYLPWSVDARLNQVVYALFCPCCWRTIQQQQQLCDTGWYSCAWGEGGSWGRGNKLISFSSSSHYWEESGRKGLRAAVGISASNRLIGHVSAFQPESILQNFMGEEALPISMDWINTWGVCGGALRKSGVVKSMGMFLLLLLLRLSTLGE